MTKEVQRKKFWINPHVHCGCECGSENEEHDESCVDQEDAYRLIYELPGVKKENITIKVTKNGLRLNAVRDKFVEYVNEYPFLTEGDPDSTDAIYQEGLLVVTVPIIGKDQFKDAKPIKIK